MKKLQIGDKIYTVNINNNKVHKVSEVFRIHQNFVQTKDDYFSYKKQIKNNKCFPYSKAIMKYNSCMDYFIETQELKDTFEKQQLIEIISKFDFNKLDLKTLIEINSKLTEIK